ncbi:MAG: hypothetical protein WCT53_00960 [Candidatus Gracilibacteria bacterium]
MAAFRYIALNQEGSELSGIIEAPDEQAARKKLNELKLSVVSLNVAATPAEVAGAPAVAGKTTFEFEAIDKQGKKVIGTIVAVDALKAFARLFDEYQLNVIYLANATLSAQEKDKIRQDGISQIQAEYEKTYGAEKKAQMEKQNVQLDGNMQETREELLVKVDATMARIEQFLKDFGADLKPDEGDIIKSYLNQLVRIKDSTNLEHIRSTCEKMLQHIQRQELFIHEEKQSKESAQIKIETKDLLSSLKQTGLSKNIDIVKIAMGWQSNVFLRPLANIILKIFKPGTPEIQKLKTDIKTINSHIWSYVKIIFIGKTKTLKIEAWESIVALRQEKKRLNLQLSALESELREKELANRPQSMLFEQIGSILGIILAFYLLSYIISYPFTIKQFNVQSIPKGFYFYHSHITKIVTIALFIAYCSVTLRNYWLKKFTIAPYILYPLSLFGFLLIIINLI